MAFRLTATRPAQSDWRQLWSAIESDDIDQVEEILADGSLANCIGPHGVTPLLHAVCHNREKIVSTLIEHGADVNAVRADGFTALLLATFFGYGDLVQTLVQQGANVTATTRFATSAKMWATARGFHDIAEYLQQWQDNRGRLELVAAPPAPLNDDGVHNYQESDLTFEKPELEVEPDGSWSPDEIAARPVLANDQTATTPGRGEVTERSTEPLVVRRLKEPPEIWDLVHENPSDFNPRSALVSRIMATKLRAMALTLGVILILVACTFAGLTLRSQRQRSSVPESAAPSGAPLAAAPAESSLQKTKTNEDTTRHEQTQRSSSPNANPIVKVESKEPSENKLTGSKLNETDSLIGSSQPITRRPSKTVRRPIERVNNPGGTAGGTVVKSPTAQTSQAVESSSNDNIGVRVATPPPKKPSHSSTNSQVITRPFGTSTAKPKVIQWP